MTKEKSVTPGRETLGESTYVLRELAGEGEQMSLA